MAIAEDISTPVPTHQAQTTTGTVTSAAFTPPANSLIVVLVSWMWLEPGFHFSALSCSDSSVGSYGSATVELDNIQQVTTAIFQHYYVSSPGSITVTVTCGNHDKAAILLAPRVLDGAAQVQTGNAGTSRNDGNLLLTTTAAGSLIYTVGGAPSALRNPVPDVTITQLDSFQSFGTGLTFFNGVQGAIGRTTIITKVAGKVWTGWKANMAQAVAAEIVPAAPALLGTGGLAGPSWQTGQVLAAADVNTWLLPVAQQKLSPTSLTAAVFQPDPDLQLPLISSGNWVFRLSAFFDGPNTANFKWTWNKPPNAFMTYMSGFINGAATIALENHSQPDSITANLAGLGVPQAILIDGAVQVTTPGVLSFSWAPTVAVTQLTPVTVYQGSYIIGWRQA